MAIDTVWLDSKTVVAGQDQVGIRGTSVRMYSHLVPGITNVTERARYFSLHPYIVHLWAKTKSSNDILAFRQFVRRIECLLALVERIRVHDSEEDPQGIVGSLRIKRWLREKAHPLPDGLRVPLRKLEQEYFQNKWGAFGQYYSAPEQALGIIDWTDELPKLYSPLGQDLAQSIESAAKKGHLPQLVDEDNPEVAQLRRLGDELRFGSLENQEKTVLKDILLDLSNRYGESGARRRLSLLLILSAAHQSLQGIDDPNWQILDAALQSRLPTNAEFKCPPSLAHQLALWQIYALHEYLAFSLENVLAVAVEEVGRSETTDRVLTSVADLAERISTLLPRSFSKKKVGDLQRDSVASLKFPALDPDADPFEEQILREAARDALGDGNFPKALTESLKLITRVSERVEPHTDTYDSFRRESMPVDAKRLSLNDLSAYLRDNRRQEMARITADIVKLVVNAHLRVATAKLAFNNDFTFKLVFEGGILRKVREVDPTFSRPRLQQGAQILADLGLLNREGGRFRTTADGVSILRDLACSHAWAAAWIAPSPH